MQEMLEPKDVWKYFNEITQIPRPSKKEEKIIAYLLDFAKKHNLEAERDKVGNVVIRKKATPGYENRKTAILQSHSDMVCEKNNDVEHDFLTDPIKTYQIGDWMRAKGTTLGADDGIGIAASLAVLAADNLQHGPLECLFTMDEESGMTGANNLQPEFIKGDVLLNLDSEDEGELFIGCAGGIDTIARFEFDYQDVTESYYACRIKITGLKGGHSGDEINKGLGNSNKILGRFLYEFGRENEFLLADFQGGNLRNAIPREAACTVCVKQHTKERLSAALNKFWAKMQQEFSMTEPDLFMSLDTCELPQKAIDSQTARNLVLSLQACPHGAISMSQSIDNLVETSTNLASVKMLENQIIEVVTSQRSSVDTAKENIAATVAAIFQLSGAQVEHGDGYPGWQPNNDSPILRIAAKSYERLFGKKPQVKAIHAGLECGLFLTKYPHLDMISFGPTIKGAHSPDERINIPTVKMFYEHLLDILKNMEEK